MEKIKTQTLRFYTLGPEFTRLNRDFIREGSFYQAYEILKDGGAPEEYIKKFFLFTAEFVGDSRDDSFAIGGCKPVYATEDKLGQTYYYALRTLMTQIYNNTGEDLDREDLDMRLLKKDKNYQSLLKVLSQESIINLVLPFTNTGKHYTINPTYGKDMYVDGVITKYGHFIGCKAQQHMEMYPDLFILGLVDDPDWTDSNESLHISSGELSGGALSSIEHADHSDYIPPKEQLDTLFNYRKHLRTYGFGNKSVGNLLLEYTQDITEKGGKFNNLTFLKRFYPEINLPKFSLEPLEIGSQCIRTSPKYSMPGLLNSKFEIDERSIIEIEEDFEKYKDHFGMSDNEKYKNKLHYFYQEFIEGENGVAHYRGYNRKEFTYSISSTQGDIVKGKESKEALSYEISKKLEDILRELSEDLDSAIQVEFVISDDDIYVVQLRLLSDEPTYLHYSPDEEDILYRGKSFSKGHETVSLKETLIIDDDMEDSSLLIGKKALIVRNDVEFSHMLALSKALNIPSIYAVGNVEIPNEFNIITNAEEGLIMKPKQ